MNKTTVFAPNKFSIYDHMLMNTEHFLTVCTLTQQNTLRELVTISLGGDRSKPIRCTCCDCLVFLPGDSVNVSLELFSSLLEHCSPLPPSLRDDTIIVSESLDAVINNHNI